VNPKWHYKIKQFSAKTVVKNLRGPQKSRNSIKRKASMHLSVVKIVEQKLAQTLMVEAADKADQDNLSKSHVQSVVTKTPYLSNQEEIDRSFVGIVSAKKDRDNFL